MKNKLLFALLLSFLVGGNLNAQVSVGNFARIPDPTVGTYYYPQLAFGIVDSTYIIALRCCQNDDYASFDNDSRLLIRLSDSSTVKLSIIPDINVEKDFKTEYSTYFHRNIDRYITYTYYSVDQEFIDKLSNDLTLDFVKVRIVFTNGNVKNYVLEDRDKKHKDRTNFMIDFRVSKNACKLANEKRKANMNDEDF